VTIFNILVFLKVIKGTVILILIKRISSTGERGLEVRGHGARPPVPVDLHNSRGRRHRRHYPAGSDALRHPDAHRHKAIGDRLDDGQAQCGQARVVSGSISIDLSLDRYPVFRRTHTTHSLKKPTKAKHK